MKVSVRKRRKTQLVECSRKTSMKAPRKGREIIDVLIIDEVSMVPQ